eukprot:TRINITY_DN3279_c6_g1_i1.p1 TRINITY_DN3279_c6_g1~~TRINITY_DN3279_c6_g1_i1.p1  ORF type:complete len:239 (+),score=56.52 TRINITY_DN3279_c6_g1_i1:30-746(+)
MSKDDFDTGQDLSLNAFATYEEYLDSQINETDLFYLESQDLARQLVELGFKGSGDVLSREDFEAQKANTKATTINFENLQYNKVSVSANRNLEGFPFLQALQTMEEEVRSGKLSVILFLRCLNNVGQEISGYIDFGARLRSEDFTPYFDTSNHKKLLPKPSDLSYYNWETGQLYSNSSQNFEVITDPEEGLLFKNKRDRKIIVVDPKKSPGSGTECYEIRTHEYDQVIIYEHVTKRKT